MRELEGLSYDEIAARMGITVPAVESMLFRARRGLRDEYGQIATGERCLRMRDRDGRIAEGMGGLRDGGPSHGTSAAAMPARRVRDGLARGSAPKRPRACAPPFPASRRCCRMPGFLNRRPDETSRLSSESGRISAETGQLSSLGTTGTASPVTPRRRSPMSPPPPGRASSTRPR